MASTHDFLTSEKQKWFKTAFAIVVNSYSKEWSNISKI